MTSNTHDPHAAHEAGDVTAPLPAAATREATMTQAALTQESTQAVTEPLPVSETTPLPVTEETAPLPVSEKTAPLAVSEKTAPLPTFDAEHAASQATVRAGADAAAQARPHSDPEAVWSASTAASAPEGGSSWRSRVRGTTALWGVILVAVGGILLAMAAGVHVSLVTSLVVALAGAGLALAVAALLPAGTGRSPHQAPKANAA